MKLKYFLFLVYVISCAHISEAQESDNSDIFTIYLVRHAEKVVSTSDRNPPLTPCGSQRANSLAEFFDLVDLDMVYSTDYLRTMNTAKPTAVRQGKTITKYDPRALAEFARLLLDKQQDVLVIGHSNTTGVLAGILIGEEMGSFDESIYNRIYQVVISQNQGRLHILNSSFVCDL